MVIKVVSIALVWGMGLVSAFCAPAAYTNVAYGTDPAQVMDIYLPPGKASDTALVLIHGGGFVSGDKQDLTLISQYLAGMGYTVANINYRLTTATTNRYPTAVNDVQAATQWFQNNEATYNVKTTQIAAFGTSAGAYLALTLGISGTVQAVVDFYGPTNFADHAFLADSLNGTSNAVIMSTYFGFTFTQAPLRYVQASPISNLTMFMPPTIIFQGTADTTIPYGQSVNLNTTLAGLGVSSQLNLEPGAPHGFLTAAGYNPVPVLLQVRAFLSTILP
jgi:acetyl esterase/lipase